MTGISQSSIGKIIAKESLPTMPTVEKICDALGVTMAQFFACLLYTSGVLLKVWIELKAEGSALFVWQSLSILLIRRK